MVLWANSDLFHVTGEKNKVCKVLQMAWTFVNDRWGFCASGFTAWLVFICKECKVIWWCHNNLVLQRAKTQTTSRVVCSLCTMLSLQWEPEIIAVAVMYLAGRLCKFDIQEWTNKQSTRRWWEQFVQDVPVELLEGTQHKDVPLKASSFVFFFFCLYQKKHVFAFQTFATRSWTCTLRETNPSLSRCRRRRGHLLLRSLLLQLHRDNRQPLTLLPHHQKRLPLRVVARHASLNAHM